MRIDAYNQVAEMYKTSKANRTNKAVQAYQTGVVNQTGTDQVQISRTGKDYQIARQALTGASDIREDKVAELKERISSGNYEVSVDDFASKLLEQYNAIG